MLLYIYYKNKTGNLFNHLKNNGSSKKKKKKTGLFCTFFFLFDFLIFKNVKIIEGNNCHSSLPIRARDKEVFWR
jgi:hypothetical protein